MSEAERPTDSYGNFNDFHPHAQRRCAALQQRSTCTLCCPADGKVLVYDQLEVDAVLPIQGHRVPIAALVACNETAARYAQGSALVVRLAPYDYHRYHFFDSGSAGPAHIVGDRYPP